jgi:hypothetical protein
MKQSRIFPVFKGFIFGFFFFSISLWLVGFHEMWRDELQAWLIARDSTSLINLYNNLQHEGTTGLWHLFLYLLTRIFESPVTMQYFHVAISSISIFILFVWSPFTTTQKVLLSFSYFLFYEYSIIARNYSISVMLIFLACALFSRRKIFPFTFAITLFLLSHTNVFGLIFAICIFLTIFFDEIVVRKRNIVNHSLTIKEILAIIFVFLGFFFASIQLLSSNDINDRLDWYFYPNLDRFKYVYQAMVGAYIPFPEISLSFWNSPLLLTKPSLAYLSFLPMSILSIFCIYFFRRPTSFFLYFSLSVSLLLFFYASNHGALRHKGFLFISFISALWIYNSCDTKNYFKNFGKLKVFDKLKFNNLINFFFIVHFCSGLVVNILDYKYHFSSAKQTAEFLKKNNLSNLQIIGHGPTIAVAGYLPNKKIYFADTNRFGTWIKNDISILRKLDLEYLDAASAKFVSQYGDALLILNFSIEEISGDRRLEYRFEKLFESDNCTVKSEKFYVYRFLH